ncbi:nuclear transport factor 2 family protein [Nocardia sp. NPDC051030]|uniref:nuclear transport factor 2 family protein n=1 Tax=Nocardia sp. NPDC051030 TaxID=3155162 RepID=UPI0034236674
MKRQWVDAPEYNKDLVSRFYDLVFNEQRVGEAASEFMTTDCLEHDPICGDGSSGFLISLGELLGKYPNQWSNVLRVLAEGDTVFLHSHMELGDGQPHLAVAEFFRIDAGMIDEHWDNVEFLPGQVRNNGRIFGGPRVPLPVAVPDIQRNKQIVTDFLTALFTGPVEELPALVDKNCRPDFVQHGSSYGDGVAAYASGMTTIREQLEVDSRGAFKIARIIGDGNFVVAHTFTPYAENEAEDHSGRGTVNIFHLDDQGRIGHHWETVQLHPRVTKSGNSVWDNGR